MSKDHHSHNHKHCQGHDHNHDHKHNHKHNLGHNHSHQYENIRLAFFLNLFFTLIEIVGGLYTNSLAILSDALHDLGDSIAIGFAWFLEKKSHKASNLSYSYGHRRLSVLSALITGIVLIFGALIILWNAIPRFINPEQPQADGMIVLAIFGIAVNGFAAFRLSKGHSVNEKMILLHLMEDVLGWVFVLVGSVVMKFYHVPVLDVIMACALSIWVLYNAIKNLKQVFLIFLQATPSNIDPLLVQEEMKKHIEVKDIHHFHVWTIDGENHYLTAHIVLKNDISLEKIHQLKIELKNNLKKIFQIIESTLEIESPNDLCSDPEHSH